jgi:hypothetical protein
VYHPDQTKSMMGRKERHGEKKEITAFVMSTSFVNHACRMSSACHIHIKLSANQFPFLRLISQRNENNQNSDGNLVVINTSSFSVLYI